MKDGELPKTWGLLVPDKNGNLREKVKAPQLEPVPLTRPFLAAVLRRVQEHHVSTDEIEAAAQKARAEGILFQKNRSDGELRHAEGQLETMTQRVKAFTEATGISVLGWGDDRRLAAKLRLVEAIEKMDAWKATADILSQIHYRASNHLKAMETVIEEVKNLEAELVSTPSGREAA